MPYEIRPNGSEFEVVNKNTGKVHAKHTTKEKAEKQVRLLEMVEHGKMPEGVAK